MGEKHGPVKKNSKITHLLSQFIDGQRTIGLHVGRRQRRNAGHEEVKTRERDHIDGQLAQIRVELAGETQARRDAGHSHRY